VCVVAYNIPTSCMADSSSNACCVYQFISQRTFAIPSSPDYQNVPGSTLGKALLIVDGQQLLEPVLVAARLDYGRKPFTQRREDLGTFRRDVL